MEAQRHQDPSELYQEHINNTRQQVARRLLCNKAVFYTSTFERSKRRDTSKNKAFFSDVHFFPPPSLFIHKSLNHKTYWCQRRSEISSLHCHSFQLTSLKDSQDRHKERVRQKSSPGLPPAFWSFVSCGQEYSLVAERNPLMACNPSILPCQILERQPIDLYRSLINCFSNATSHKEGQAGTLTNEPCFLPNL